MTSLAELYAEIENEDNGMGEIEKVAGLEAVEELFSQPQEDDEAIKLASEYDAAGRIMARGFIDDLLKSAAEAEEGKDEEDDEEEEEEDRKRKEGAKKRGIPPQFLSAMAEKKAEFVQDMINDPEYAQEMIDWYNNQ